MEKIEKSIFWLKFSRKGATIAASLLMFVGLVLDLIFRFLGISSQIGFYIVGSGMILFAICFLLTVVISFCIDKLQNEKEKTQVNEKTKTKHIETNENQNKPSFFKKIIGLFEKYEHTIKLFFYSLAFALACYFAYTVLASEYYWNVYYFICLFMWVMLVSAILQLFYTKDKKSLIFSVLVVVAGLGFLIWGTVLSHNMFFNASAKINLKTIDIVFLVSLFWIIVSALVGASENNIAKVKKTRNFGLGIILFCAGLCMYFLKSIASFILNKWDTTADLKDRVQYLTIPMNIAMYVIICLTIVSMIYVAFNTVHYIKTKNYLGIADVSFALISVILSLLGILNFANMIILLK